MDNKSTLELLVYNAPDGQWAVLGDTNKTVAAQWLKIAGLHGTAAELEAGLATELLRVGDRRAHRKIASLWRRERLLLRGVRLSDYAFRGRAHAEALADAQPARSARWTERAFRRELIAQVRRARALYHPSPAERREILHFVRAESGMDLNALRPPPTRTSQSEAASLAAWKELLEWFRGTFPYNRAQCEACGASHGDVLGNVRPPRTARDPRTSAASRVEIQLCGACGTPARFLRHNHIGSILRNRKGRCGEYTQVLFRLARALGWRTRFVIDWTDHMWVELLLPVAPASEAPRPAEGAAECDDAEDAAGCGLVAEAGGSQWSRWVMLDPCEAAVDEPMLYASWGKTHDYVIAIGDGRIVDRTRAYARDWQATVEARDMSDGQLERALRHARLRCAPPK